MTDGAPGRSRPYLTEPHEHLLDLIEHLYQEGHWRVDDEWARPMWEAIAELHHRVAARTDDELALVRARADRRRQLLDRCLPHLSADVALADEVTCELYEEQAQPRVRPVGYEGVDGTPPAPPDVGL